MFSAAVVKPLLYMSPRLPPLSSSFSVYFRLFHPPLTCRFRNLITRLRLSFPPAVTIVATLFSLTSTSHVPCLKSLFVLPYSSAATSIAASLSVLLHAARHSCTALYLKIWFQVLRIYGNQCPWEDDLKYAKHVCEQVNVPLEVVHLTDEYWERVVRHGPDFYSCSFEMESEGDAAVVHLDGNDQRLAAGQFAAFYKGTTCIGSGVSNSGVMGRSVFPGLCKIPSTRSDIGQNQTWETRQNQDDGIC